MAKCEVCFRHCNIEDGSLGFCGARTAKDGKVIAKNYGKITGLALDPIEKKPLNRFFPGSSILSVGSFGCNLRCPFCQNYDISWSDNVKRLEKECEYVSPKELVDLALDTRAKGNIGIAFTYNEPLVCYEYVRDTAKLAHQKGLVCVLVTNGTAALPVLEELIPYIDAMNIDLKGFTDRYYRDVLKGDRAMTMDFIREAVRRCHVELTTLIVPGENDTRDEMREISGWIAGLQPVYGGKTGRDIPLHISRFFPRYRMTDRKATDVRLVYELAETARENLRYVHTGNC